MRNFLSLTLILVIGLVLTTSCNRNSTPDPDKDSDKTIAAKTISLATATLLQVTPPESGDSEGWSDLKLEFNEVTESGGTVEVTGAKTLFDRVWKDETFNWRWANDTATQVERTSDDQIMTIVSLTDNELVLEFEVASPNARSARVAVIDGSWKFVFELSKDN